MADSRIIGGGAVEFPDRDSAVSELRRGEATDRFRQRQRTVLRPWVGDHQDLRSEVRRPSLPEQTHGKHVRHLGEGGEGQSADSVCRRGTRAGPGAWLDGHLEQAEQVAVLDLDQAYREMVAEDGHGPRPQPHIADEPFDGCFGFTAVTGTAKHDRRLANKADVRGEPRSLILRGTVQQAVVTRGVVRIAGRLPAVRVGRRRGRVHAGDVVVMLEQAFLRRVEVVRRPCEDDVPYELLPDSPHNPILDLIHVQDGHRLRPEFWQPRSGALRTCQKDLLDAQGT